MSQPCGRCSPPLSRPPRGTCPFATWQGCRLRASPYVYTPTTSVFRSGQCQGFASLGAHPFPLRGLRLPRQPLTPPSTHHRFESRPAYRSKRTRGRFEWRRREPCHAVAPPPIMQKSAADPPILGTYIPSYITQFSLCRRQSFFKKS